MPVEQVDRRILDVRRESERRRNPGEDRNSGQPRQAAARPRLLFLIAGSLIAMAISFPLWSFTLWAPQYPEGLRMVVGTEGIHGDLEIINTLNHYVGMKPIRPEDFPELGFLPTVFAGLTLAALLPLFFPRRWLAGAAVAVVVAVAAAGLVDLYLWLYRFGHDLNPQAPISTPPFTPPILGSKQIYNFVTLSQFELGGWMLGTAIALMTVSVWGWNRW